MNLRLYKALAAAVLLIFCFTACGEKSIIQDVTGASNSATKGIEGCLEEVGIFTKTVFHSVHPLTDNMDCGWEAFDLTAEDGNEYLLIITRENKSFTAVLDKEGNLLSGIMDNTVLPSYKMRGSE